MEPERRELELASSAGRLAVAGLAVQAALAAVALGAAIASGSFAALGVAAHLSAGALAWAAGVLLVSRRRARLATEAEDEKIAQAAESEGRKPLFARQGAAALALSEARLASVLGVVLAVLEGALAVGLVLHGRGRPETAPVHLLAAAACLTASAFVLLLLAKFSVALVRRESKTAFELVVAGSRRAAAGALAALAAGVLLAVQNLAPSLGLDNAGYVFAGVEGLLAVELLLALVLELYRPRRKGELPRPGYESRILGLLAEPSGVARSFARAVDYQFGFELSETWVYGLVERGIAPLVIFVAGSFWLLSAFVVVPQGEVATHERLGQRKDLLEPGLHAKAPWPMDAAEPVARERIRTVYLGADEHDEDEHVGRHRVALWTEAHAKDEFLILVARPGGVDLLAARVSVHFVVTDPVLWASGSATPETLLEVLGERELARLGCSRSLDALLGAERAAAAEQLRDEIQKSATERGLGVRILDVGLEDLHPPVDVASAFHLESNANEEKEARRLKGLGDAAGVRPDGERQARSIRERARTEAAQKLRLARASGEAFQTALALDRAAPRVFRELARLRAIEEGLAGGGRRIVVPSRVTTEIDLTDKITEGLTNEGPPVENKPPEKR